MQTNNQVIAIIIRSSSPKWYSFSSIGTTLMIAIQIDSNLPVNRCPVENNDDVLCHC